MINNELYGQRIELPVSNGKKIVAEVNPDPDYKEIFIFLESERGEVCQDLAIVGENYMYSDDMYPGKTVLLPIPGEYAIRVYADAYDECYTNKFVVGEYTWSEESEGGAE